MDVEQNLPPKKEYVLHAPLTENQKNVYEAVVNGAIRRWLIAEKAGTRVEGGPQTNVRKNDREPEVLSGEESRQLRARKDTRKPVYDVDCESDHAYFSRLEKGELNALEEAEENRRWGIKMDASEGDTGLAYMKRAAGVLLLLNHAHALVYIRLKSQTGKQSSITKRSDATTEGLLPPFPF